MPDASAVDGPRLHRTLGQEDLDRLVRLLARRIEFETPLTGRLSLPKATERERRALGALLGGRPTASIELARLEEILRSSGIAPSLEAAVQTLKGPIVPRALSEAAEREAKERALVPLRECVHAAEPWFAEWARTLPVTRLVRTGSADLVARAVAVLDRLPATALPLPVLAERATGDTKALQPEEPLGRQILRALALREGVPPAEDREAQRALWTTAGVIMDDLASQVLVLNLPADGGMVASWLTDAAAEGLPFRLTLQQLTLHPVVPDVPELFVCENPAVLRAAAAELGPRCAPLVCTEGIPSAACHALLASVASAGIPIRWRADFDWAGLRMVSAALTRYAARPWRMASADFTAALGTGPSEPLRGAPADAPWDPLLARALTEAGRAVMEERLLDVLLTDLRW
jgi:uncharacterized protein (TIGR02679 family)